MNAITTRPLQLAMMAAPPLDPAECEQLGEQLWIGLTQRYQQNATATDIELLRKLPDETHNAYEQALRRFDEFILKQFAEWGWRMLLSKEIVRMLARWEAQCPERLEQLGAALALKSKVYRAEKSAPFPDDIDKFADATIVELKSLFRKQRYEFQRARAVKPRCDRIAEWIKGEVEALPSEYPMVSAHLGQLCAYIGHYLPTRNKKAAQLLETGRTRADSFFYQWYSVSTTRNVNDVRTQISRRRTQRLTSSK